MLPDNQPAIARVDEPRSCCSSPWEDAYARFETPEEEIRKFMGRLLQAGARSWRRDSQIVELFCGRGNGLCALNRLGFENIEGADLSEQLLAQYTGPARCCLCDCRSLPFEDSSRDILIIQGGLHHLPQLPADLEKTLSEMRRVLRPGGFAVIVEPWLTPFLRFVHTVCAIKLARRFSTKIDCMAIMIENERETYEQWLGAPEVIQQCFRRAFDHADIRTQWGKMVCIGHVRKP